MKKIYTLLTAILAFAYADVVAQDGMSIGTNTTPDEMLDVNGAIRIGADFVNDPVAAPDGGVGTVRFRGGNFEGYTSLGWVLLSSAGTDDQNLTAATLTGTDLKIEIENGNFTTADLSDLDQSGDVTALETSLNAHISDDDDTDDANEIQDLTLLGNTLSLSGSTPASVDLSGFNNSGTDDQDLGTAVLNGSSQLSIAIEDGTATTADLSALEESADIATVQTNLDAHVSDDDDTDETNEIQNLGSTVSGTDRTITISDGGTSTTISVADNDNSITNEIQTAAQVEVTPNGNLTSEDVQAALVELQGDINGIAPTIADVLDNGDVATDGQNLEIDKVRARDTDGLLLTDATNKGVFIENGGNVGIGTIDPSNLFHVKGNGINVGPGSNENVIARFEQATGSSGMGIQIMGQRTSPNPSSFIDFRNLSGDTPLEYSMARVSGVNEDDGYKGALAFYTNPGTTVGGVTEKMRITSAGVVRISGLAGSGNRLIQTDNTGNLSVSSINPSAVGTVTTVSVTTANGVLGTVTNPTTTPAISLSLGAITPTSVAASGTVTGSNLSGTHSGTSSGTNTGNQSLSISGSTISLTNGGSVTVPSSADNLGNHIATQNVELDDNWLSNDGGNEGIEISNSGNVRVVGAGTIAGSNLANSYILAGTSTVGIGMDPNELYFKGADGNFGVLGPNKLSINVNGGTRLTVNTTGTVNISDLAGTDVRSVSATATGTLTDTQPTTGASGFWTRNGSDLHPTTIADNVGIGIASPTTTLHIRTSDNTSDYPTATTVGDQGLRLERSNQVIEIGQAGGSNARRAWILARHSSSSYGQYYSTLHLQPDVGDLSQYRGVAIGYDASTALPVGTHLAVAGKVGIGTTTPTPKVEIDGVALMKTLLTSDIESVASDDGLLDYRWHDALCSSGYAMQSMTVRHTDKMDGEAIINCVNMNGLLTGSNGWYTEGASVTTATAESAGLSSIGTADDDNSDHEGQCPDGRVATGFTVYARARWDRSLKLRCQALVAGVTTANNGDGFYSTMGNYGYGDNNRDWSACPTGTVVKSIRAYASNDHDDDGNGFLDGKLRMYCTGISPN